jgi:hypothetical protein
VRILGPSKEYYKQLLQEQLSLKSAIARSLRPSWRERALARRRDYLEEALEFMPDETLTDEGTTTERNNSSAICLVSVSGRRLLFTGDAGIPALSSAAANFESTIGRFASNPLTLFQAPHHGSRRNVGPTVLDRILGRPGRAHGPGTSAVCSSAKSAPKHPSPKVVNALTRRGCEVVTTEGVTVRVSHEAPARPGWSSINPLPPLLEDYGDDD